MTVKDLPHHVAFAVVFPIWSAVSVQARRGSRQVMLQTTRSAKVYLIHLFQVVQIRALTEQFIFFLHFYLQSPRKHGLSKWPMFCS